MNYLEIFVSTTIVQSIYYFKVANKIKHIDSIFYKNNKVFQYCFVVSLVLQWVVVLGGLLIVVIGYFGKG